MLIGVDYHPSFQQIAFLDQETGECGERRLNHSDGEAEKFYTGQVKFYLKSPVMRNLLPTPGSAVPSDYQSSAGLPQSR
jgi:hypothetical protein